MARKKKARTAASLSIQLRDARQTKVRYGRATLTIRRAGSVYLSPVAEVLSALKRGEASEEDVARAFIEDRVIEHSPSFDWEQVDLVKLLPRVAGVAREPEIKAKTPAELIPELRAQEKREQKIWEEGTKRMQKQMHAMSGQWLKPNSQIAQLGAQMQRRNAALAKAIQPDLSAFNKLNINLTNLNRTVMPQVQLPNFGINATTYLGLNNLAGVDLTGINNISKAFGAGNTIPGGFVQQPSWQKLFERFAAAAKEAEYPEVVTAVEATVEEATKGPEAADLNAVVERLDALLDETQRLGKNGAVRQIAIGVAILLIFYILQSILAAKYGIQFPPPPQQSPH